MTYPISFRRHVLAVKEREGLTFSETADRFAVGIASLVRWSKEIAPKVYRRKKGLKIDLGRLAQDVREYPDAYQYERAARFGVTPKAIWQALRKLGVTYKSEAGQKMIRGIIFPLNDASSEGGRRRAARLPGED